MDKGLQNHFLRVNDLTLRYRVAGTQGDTVVLIHGLGGSLENWQYNIAELAMSYRVYALDLPGFGLSDKPNTEYTLNFMLDVFMDFLDALKLESVALVGNSLGGGLALMAAIQYPRRINKLVLCSSAGLSRRLPTLFKLLTIPFINRLFMRPTFKRCQFGLRNITKQHHFITNNFVDTQYQYYLLPGANYAFLNILENFACFWGVKISIINQISRGLNNLLQPTLVIWGKQDKLLPFNHSKSLIARIPYHNLNILDDCGHLPQLEHPQQVNNLIINFLNQK